MARGRKREQAINGRKGYARRRRLRVADRREERLAARASRARAVAAAFFGRKGS